MHNCRVNNIETVGFLSEILSANMHVICIDKKSIETAYYPTVSTVGRRMSDSRVICITQS